LRQAAQVDLIDMPRATISRNIVCFQCGSATFEVPPNASWETVIQCSQCRKEVGPLGQLKDQLMGRASIVTFVNVTDIMITPVE
jgi:hypothetical protein